jgi:hypothetical protein
LQIADWRRISLKLNSATGNRYGSLDDPESVRDTANTFGARDPAAGQRRVAESSILSNFFVYGLLPDSSAAFLSANRRDSRDLERSVLKKLIFEVDKVARR